jgi:Asp-tRNA(Asn)/Glu-tRNA(Gln) amidotransferase B subunit
VSEFEQSIRVAIAEVRAEHPDTDKRFHAESFLLGAVMRKLHGRANPGVVINLLREEAPPG